MHHPYFRLHRTPRIALVDHFSHCLQSKMPFRQRDQKLIKGLHTTYPAFFLHCNGIIICILKICSCVYKSHSGPTMKHHLCAVLATNLLILWYSSELSILLLSSHSLNKRSAAIAATALAPIAKKTAQTVFDQPARLSPLNSLPCLPAYISVKPSHAVERTEARGSCTACPSHCTKYTDLHVRATAG